MPALRASRASSRRGTRGRALAEAEGQRIPLGAVSLAHPVVPRKLICIGLNYRDHAEESELDIPAVPVVFAKWTTSLIGHGETIVIPREETRPDYEGELAIVIGAPVYRAEGAAARAAIGAYTCFHDVSGRRAQLETPLRQFTYGKSFDTFGPLGPCLVDAEGADLDALQVTTVVSGETMQDSNTSNLIFGIEALVEYVSLGTTLEPGDVIATGTPGGVGDSRNPRRYLREGDVVDVTVAGVGTLSNPVTLEAWRSLGAADARGRAVQRAHELVPARDKVECVAERRARGDRRRRDHALVAAEAQPHALDPRQVADDPDGHLDTAGEPVGETPRVGSAAEHVDAVETVERAVAVAAERDRDAPRIGAQVGEVAHARPAEQSLAEIVAAQRGVEHHVGAGTRQRLGDRAGRRLGNPRDDGARSGGDRGRVPHLGGGRVRVDADDRRGQVALERREPPAQRPARAVECDEPERRATEGGCVGGHLHGHSRERPGRFPSGGVGRAS